MNRGESRAIQAPQSSTARADTRHGGDREPFSRSRFNSGLDVDPHKQALRGFLASGGPPQQVPSTRLFEPRSPVELQLARSSDTVRGHNTRATGISLPSTEER